jgi:oligopeptide transport system substrate-binding protein
VPAETEANRINCLSMHTMMKPKFLIKTFLPVLLCFALVGCVGSFFEMLGFGSAKLELGENVLHMGNGAEPQDLDPHAVTGVTEHRILSSLFEGLVSLDPATLEPRPGAAESWEVSADGLVYTFTIREGAQWSNGDPLTAHDFVYSWRRILTPTLGSEYANMLYAMENAEAYNRGEIEDFSLVGCKALDDRRLRVKLEYPTPYFLSMQVHYTWFPVHQETIEAHGRMDERGTRWTWAENMVSNGPYMLASWRPDRDVTVVRNPRYWDAESVQLDAIRFYPIDNAQTELLLFRVGRLDMTSTIPVEKIDYYQYERPEITRIDPYLGTYYYRLNVTEPPFDDPRVRQAFALSVDREDLVSNVVRGGRKPAHFYTPPDTAGYTSEAEQPFAPEQARRLLAEAGYPNGEGFPRVEILYNTSEDHKKVAEALQDMWREVLNVEVGLLNQEWKVYLNSMNQLDYDMARSGWIGDYVDPINFLECFVTGNGNNRTGFSNEEYDALIALATAEVDPRKRAALFQEAEKILLEQAPVIPIYFYTSTYLMTPALKGREPNLLGYISYKDLYFGPIEER